MATYQKKSRIQNCFQTENIFSMAAFPLIVLMTLVFLNSYCERQGQNNPITINLIGENGQRDVEIEKLYRSEKDMSIEMIVVNNEKKIVEVWIHRMGMFMAGPTVPIVTAYQLLLDKNSTKKVFENYPQVNKVRVVIFGPRETPEQHDEYGHIVKKGSLKIPLVIVALNKETSQKVNWNWLEDRIFPLEDPDEGFPRFIKWAENLAEEKWYNPKNFNLKRGE